MSALPQRKKSAEEIAKLREEMGLPPAVPASPVDAPAPTAAATPAVPEEIRPKPAAKAVRSLRRSERKPVPEPTGQPVASGASNLPAYRRSERELEAMRRQEAMQILRPGAAPPGVLQLKQITAHPALLTLGYVLALAWGIGGIAVGAYIAVKKPRSRHHAGFMTAIAVLVLVYAALHYFPNLNPVHAS